jgi:predicted transcriptional regulator
MRAVRRSLGLSQDALREPLRVGPASIARYEMGDAPAWMRYALIGVGVLERGVPVDEMVRRVEAETGVEPGKSTTPS